MPLYNHHISRFYTVSRIIYEYTAGLHKIYYNDIDLLIISVQVDITNARSVSCDDENVCKCWM